MNILLECFIPVESGPIFTLGLAKGLINNNVEVYALLAENIENKEEWNKLLQSNHICYLKSNLSFKKCPISTFKEYFRVKQYFGKVHFDFLLDTFPMGTSNKMKYLVKSNASMGIDHDVVPHSSVKLEDATSTQNYIKKMDNVIVLSKSYMDIAQKKYGLDKEHIFYLRHGALEYPEKSVKKQYYNLKSINFLYFGRIDGYKGLHVLAGAYGKLRKKYTDVSLTIAGGGNFSEYKAEYANLQDCLIVNKYLNDDDIAYYFNMPNVVIVLPYIDASQSGVISMAFYYRKPIIVSDTGGLKEQLFNGEMGLFVEPKNVDDLYKKMEMFILNKLLYSEQVKLMDRGYKKSTWNSCVKEFLIDIKEKNVKYK